MKLYESENKELYRKFSQSESTIPIFSQHWWLDAVCGNNWDACLVMNGDQINAAMPYHTKSRLGFKLLTHPLLTQTLGPWIRPSTAKISNRLSQEKDLLSELINQLPPYDYFNQNWHHANTNWLPFYWQGFQQTTRYTYRLPDLRDMDVVWAGFRENVRSDIRKAERRFNLKIRTDLDVDTFFRINRKTFERQCMNVPYTIDFLRNLDSACQHNNARKIFIAEDEQGNHHAGVYIIWDQQSAYYLMGGGDPELRTSGATSLCMWAAIQHAATVTKSFDFEGSMIEPVERFFRAFGAVQTPYFSISKTPSRLLRTINFVRTLRGK